MTVVLRQQRKSRLSSLVDAPGGLSVGVALAQAQVNLGALADKGRELLDRRIVALAALRPDETDPVRARNAAYDLAGEIIDAGTLLNLGDVCKAAAGLCDLIDAAGAEGRLDWRIVSVHARSLQLMCALPADAADERARLLDQLELLKQRFAAPEA